MNADNPQPSSSQQPPKPATAATGIKQTVLEHPQLPAGATLLERILLPAVFSTVVGVVRNPGHAAELEQYMLAIRDAINAAYPDAE
jgi:hypothetical protein